jgi:hypothetical protein
MWYTCVVNWLTTARIRDVMETYTDDAGKVYGSVIYAATGTIAFCDLDLDPADDGYLGVYRQSTKAKQAVETAVAEKIGYLQTCKHS